MTELVAGLAPFHLLTIGPFGRSAVHCLLGDERAMRSADTDALIAEAWEQRTRDAHARGQLLFPGALCRLQAWEVTDGELELRFGRTDYRELVGTNLTHPNLPAGFRSEGCGVCTTLETSDGFLLVQRRSERVFEYPGRLHVVGGSLEPREVDGEEIADPFAAMERELQEELGIAPDAIAEMSCLGLARDGATLKPEVLLRTRVDRKADEIATAGFEHTALLRIPADPLSMNAWLAESWADIAPAGLACMVAHVACIYADGLAASWQTR